MGEVIEKPLNVGIQHHAQSLAVQSQHGPDGLMSVPSRDVAKRVRVKPAFKKGSKEAAHHLLSDPVANGWNPKRTPLFFFVLGNVSPAKREGFKRSFPLILLQGQEILLKVSRKHLDAHLVNARFATIAPHPL